MRKDICSEIVFIRGPSTYVLVGEGNKPVDRIDEACVLIGAGNFSSMVAVVGATRTGGRRTRLATEAAFCRSVYVRVDFQLEKSSYWSM